MKLQLALIFGEHMVFQRNQKIKVWGRCANNDEITVQIGSNKVTVDSNDGSWLAELPEMEACNRTVMKVTSLKTREEICFKDVAVGEVWLAGGQSNMEFLVKYDYDALELKKTSADDYFRFFNYPHVAFAGYLEKETCADDGFWRKWDSEEDKNRFSAVGAYMGLLLRKYLQVPVAIIGCNWGGTPASAWTSKEALESNPALQQVLEDYRNTTAQITDWPLYIKTSETKEPVMNKEQQEFQDRFMMGEDMSEFFAMLENMPKPDINIYNTYPLTPRSATRPAGVYNHMLKKVAPYGIRGVIWYQGEDDDARDWAEFYNESMKALINCWRKLWGYDFPFLQVELAPFRGRGFSASKKYALMRKLQHKVSRELEDVYNICILDVGEEFNIHPRKKKNVGRRLGQVALKHVYNDNSRVADCPSAISCTRKDNQLEIKFKDVADGLYEKGNLKDVLFITAQEKRLDYTYQLKTDKLIIDVELLDEKAKINYCDENYCVAVLFNSEDNPVYGFEFEI
ncbi:MAG: sialate O-acetylesterase [Erysipelotrichaceae bacterium]|jgi:sialate O-acetylesterase